MGAPGFYQDVVSLQELHIGTIQGRQGCQGNVIHLGHGEADGDLNMKARNINNK